MAKMGKMMGGKGMHFKVRGGASMKSLRPARSMGMSKTPNPFGQARAMVKRSSGPAMMRGRPY